VDSVRTFTDYIAIHCSATPPSYDIGAEEIRLWHVRDNGWSDIGYHFVIRRDGTLQAGRALEDVGAHVRGYNSVSVGICMVGGINQAGEPEDNFTDAQWSMLYSLTVALVLRYPKATVMGHRDFTGVTKACPSFDVMPWWASKKEGHLDAVLGGASRG
jgi:N-acetyl-anhydromuramyl-L-alanine amidase AmpD